MIEWSIPGKVSVLVDGQFGSTGKGLMAAWLYERAARDKNPISTCNAGANAGHTTRFKNGNNFVCFHLPTTAIMAHRAGYTQAAAYLNAGSIIDVDMLWDEMTLIGFPSRNIYIHPRAAVIDEDHRQEERAGSSSTQKLGSTQKGVGAALAGKIMRRGVLAENNRELIHSNHVEELNLHDYMNSGEAVVMEVPQGFSLSINHGLSYPHCTSRDCWVGSGLNDAGIHPDYLGPVAMVVRTFPIRVGHIYDTTGQRVGNSGPFYPDSKECDWSTDFPDIEPERTTVTKRVRRIATWSNIQYREALNYNRPKTVMLNFCNYLKTADEFEKHTDKMREIEDHMGLDINHVYGFGPCVEDVTDDFDTAQWWYRHRRF